MKQVVVSKVLSVFSEMLAYASGINLFFIESVVLLWNKLETGGCYVTVNVHW